MLDIEFNFFTRSVEAREPEIFLENLKRCFGDEGLPERFAADDDESFFFNEQNLQKFTEFWWDGYENWERDSQGMIGMVGLGSWGDHTTIAHSFRDTPSLQDKYADFVIAVASALRADFAYAHLLSNKNSENRPNDRRLGGAVGLDLDRALPGVPWVACYGKPYIDLFGESKLLTTPIKEARKLNDGMILHRLTSHVRDIVEKPQEVAAAQEAVYKQLGRNAFYDDDDPDNDNFYIDRSKIFAPPWPDPLTVPAIMSERSLRVAKKPS